MKNLMANIGNSIVFSFMAGFAILAFLAAGITTIGIITEISHKGLTLLGALNSLLMVLLIPVGVGAIGMFLIFPPVFVSTLILHGLRRLPKPQFAALAIILAFITAGILLYYLRGRHVDLPAAVDLKSYAGAFLVGLPFVGMYVMMSLKLIWETEPSVRADS